jgi:hypothetical protein
MKNEQSSKNTLKGPQHHDWKEFVVWHFGIPIQQEAILLIIIKQSLLFLLLQVDL